MALGTRSKNLSSTNPLRPTHIEEPPRPLGGLNPKAQATILARRRSPRFFPHQVRCGDSRPGLRSLIACLVGPRRTIAEDWSRDRLCWLVESLGLASRRCCCKPRVRGRLRSIWTRNKRTGRARCSMCRAKNRRSRSSSDHNGSASRTRTACSCSRTPTSRGFSNKHARSNPMYVSSIRSR